MLFCTLITAIESRLFFYAILEAGELSLSTVGSYYIIEVIRLQFPL